MQGDDPSPLRRLAIARLAANPPAANAPLEQVRSRLSAATKDSWSAFEAEANGTWIGYVDQRSGLLAYAEGSGWPWIPGTGNQLTAEDVASFQGGSAQLDVPAMDRIARAFLPKVAPALGVDESELRLSLARTQQVADYLWYVEYDVVRDGLAIEGARVLFRVNHGNLVQFGTEGLPAPNVRVPAARISREQAVEAVASHIGGFLPVDGLIDSGTLKAIPVARIDATVADRFRFADGYGILPVWEISFRRKDVIGTWRARVDAVSGQVVEFVDANEYAQAQGGIVLVQPSLGETNRPMPFTNISTGGFTNSAGVYTYTGVATTSSLNGQYVRALDNCGAISLAANGVGTLDFLSSAASDCSTPGSGGAGNTRSSRTQSYWVNRVKEVGRGWLPSVAWLSNQLTANVNINSTCNAYWNGSTINFFRSGGGCGNTGEIPAVSLHEYGHGLDSNDGTGAPPENGSGETVGDWSAALATHSSCIGAGFRATNCSGYGNACTACTGVRDIDWAQRAANTPSTVQNFTQTTCPQPSPSNPNYVGPCGLHAIGTGITANKREGHCESYISSQSLWDLANRDLPSPGSGGAWSISDRLWYLTRATTSSFFTCSTTPATWTSDGCAAGTLFRTYRVADDDDGNLANGTPHGGAIFAAFNRHNIACASDPGANVTFSACTIPSSPTLTLTPASNQMQLSWTSSGAGVVYDVYRNEATCNSGFVKIANDLAALNLNDPNVANFFDYNYQVIAHPTGTEACGAPPSNCATAQPLPCTAPATPLIGSATTPAANQVQVSWTNGSPASDLFNVYRAFGTCAAPGPFTPLAIGVAASPYLDTTVSGGTTYAYRISGTETTGVCESAQTTCVEATPTGACTLPPTFAGLVSAANGGTSTCSVGLSWAAATAQCAGPVTYNVYRSTTPGFVPSGGNLIATGVSGTSFVDPGPLANGNAYYYIVRAVDTSNGSADTNTVQQSGTPTGPVTVGTFTETFEGAGGFDNAGWTHAPLAGAPDWAWSTAQSQTPTHSWNSTSITSVSDRVLVSPALVGQPTTTLSFWHTFALEQSTTPTTCFDGGTLETSLDGVVWTTVPDAAITAGPFVGTVSASFGSPIAGRRAWCGNTVIGPFTQVIVNLAAFNGQTFRLRWREGDDSSVARIGWFVDSVSLTNVGSAAVCALPVELLEVGVE